MKILHISYSDINGGAAIAAYRLHRSLIDSGVNSAMFVVNRSSGDFTVDSYQNKYQKVLSIVKPQIVNLFLNYFLKTKNKTIHSLSYFSSKLVNKINSSDVDIVHIHWFQREMLSISDISKIKKHVVWTMHDMWAFCGAEHYTEDFRWRDGYSKNNRPSYEKGLDINRFIWKKKIKYWNSPIHLVSPSNWLSNFARNSKLMSKWPVSVIHNPIDTKTWKPISKKLSRELLNLPSETDLLLFGAVGGTLDFRKGFDLLENSLKLLPKDNNIQLVVFGQSKPKDPPNFPFPVHYLGHVNDDLTLRTVYSAADLFILPSRQDNLPNTGIESLSCGTPVLAFNTGGLSDIVVHEYNGYLADSFDVHDFSNGVMWLLKKSNSQRENISKNARNYAVSNFDKNTISSQYIKLYKTLVKEMQ